MLVSRRLPMGSSVTMPMASPVPETNVSLLGRLSEFPANQGAWHDFVSIYGAHLLEWSKRSGLQEADAEDVTQLILLRLARVMRTFEYDSNQSFRAWLRTVAQHVWHDFVRTKRNTRWKMVNDEQTLFTLEAEQDFTHSIETAYDEEMLRKSFDSVRLRVHPQTWEAFRLTTLQEQPSQEVAERLGMKLSLVYKAKSNILKLLQEEMQYLEGSLR
jgi:RNA polymerase sigma factor (sigma-70 family)